MGGGNALECEEDVVDTPEVGVVVVGGVVGGDDEVAHATLVEAFDVATAGVALGGDGEEKGAVSLRKGTAVGEEMENGVVGTTDTRVGAFYDGSNFAGFHDDFCFMMLWPMWQSRQRRQEQ